MSSHERRVALGLGSNLAFHDLSGAHLLGRAAHDIDRCGLAIVAASSVWVSEAWPSGDQPQYVNAVLLVDAGAHTPEEVHQRLITIELAYGRERGQRWAARTLDLDIIDFDGLVLDQSAVGGLVLPHPRAHERAFVLAPLAEAAPTWIHPILHAKAEDLLAALGPDHKAERLGVLPYGK